MKEAPYHWLLLSQNFEMIFVQTFVLVYADSPVACALSHSKFFNVYNERDQEMLAPPLTTNLEIELVPKVCEGLCF